MASLGPNELMYSCKVTIDMFVKWSPLRLMIYEIPLVMKLKWWFTTKMKPCYWLASAFFLQFTLIRGINLFSWLNVCKSQICRIGKGLASIGYSHKSTGPRPTTLEEDQKFLLIFLQFYVYDLRFKAWGPKTFLTEFQTLGLALVMQLTHWGLGRHFQVPSPGMYK